MLLKKTIDKEIHRSIGRCKYVIDESPVRFWLGKFAVTFAGPFPCAVQRRLELYSPQD